VREDGTVPESPDNPRTNPFAAAGVGVHYDRGRPYHHDRTLERVVTMVDRAMVGAGRPGRGLDVACGTGMSTVALAGHADAVVGVDVSPEMMRSARPAPGVRYLLGRAERLPFPAATCCSGVHWFDQPRFFAELHRVLRPGSWVALYDHYFVGEMVGVPEFADWLRAGSGYRSSAATSQSANSGTSTISPTK
jgi:ubiquinone/menaquinone biosynthesis C-methylase UbiE